MTAEQPPVFQVERIFEVLDRHQVNYILVGGVAGILHGASRPTKDFDMVVPNERENHTRLAAAMNELGARYRTEGLSDAQARELTPPLHPSHFSASEISTWMTDAGPLDVLRDIPARTGEHLRYDDLLPRSVNSRSGPIQIRVVGLDDLIRSKEWANRPKDHESLDELRAIRDRDHRGLER